MSNKNKFQHIDNFDLNKAIDEGGFYDKNNRWNSLMKKGTKLYRVRVETLIINNKDEIFIRIHDAKNKDYRLPGGSVDRNISNLDQALAECREEAYIIVKEIKNSGLYYTSNNFIPKKICKNNLQITWDGNYTYIYIGKYDGIYKGKIDNIDRDYDMYKNGKFYPYEEVKDMLIKEHILAYELYIRENKSVYCNKSILYPYYTPKQMESIGVYNIDVSDNYYKTNASKDNSNWFKKYSETYDPGEEWYKLVQEAYIEFIKLDSAENRQTLLELGWNPEINLFNESILHKISNITKNILKIY